MQAFMNALSPGYFATMNIPLLEGRDFRLGDAKQQATVAIVNRQFAEHFFPGSRAPSAGTSASASARRRSSTSKSSASSPTRCTRDRARASAARCSSRTGARTARRSTSARNIPSAAIFALARNEIKQLDAAIPIYEMKTVEGQLDETLLTDRLIAMLSAGFGFVATLLASVGLYGVMAFVVAQRKKELGIRLALGAQPAFVIWMVMREVLLLLAIGLAIGIPAGLGLGRYVASQLYGIQANDPFTATLGDHRCWRSCRRRPG